MAVMRAGERGEEMVDRRTFLPPFLKLGQPQVGVDRVEVGVRRNDVHMIRLEKSRVAYLLDRKPCVRLQ